MVGHAGRRVDLQRPLELPLRRRPVPVEVERDRAERGMGTGGVAVELQSPLGGHAGPGNGLVERHQTEEAVDEMGTRQHGPAVGEPGVGLHHPLEVDECLAETVDRALVEEVATLEVELVGLGVDSRHGRQTLSLTWRHRHLDLAGNGGRDIHHSLAADHG